MELTRTATCLVFASLFFSSTATAQTAIEPQDASPPVAIEPAADDATDARMESLEAQVRELRSLLSNNAPKPPALAVPKAAKYPNIALNGMLHIDGGVIAQDEANIDLVGDVDNLSLIHI